MDQLITAIHEAGHSVAHSRLGINQGFISIVADEFTQGRATAEETINSASDAVSHVLAYCSGYASVIAAGYPKYVARPGCHDDFNRAQALVDFWELEPLAVWIARAVKLMRLPDNINPVAFLVKELNQHQVLDGDHAQVIIEVADGKATEEEYQRYLVMKNAFGKVV